MSLNAALVAFHGFRQATCEQFRELLDGLRQQLAPTTALEVLLVEQIVLAVSRLRTAARLEEDGKIDKDWLRYQTMAERSFWKALNTLEKNRRQAARAARVADASQPQPESLPEPPAAAIPAEPPSQPSTSLPTSPQPTYNPERLARSLTRLLGSNIDRPAPGVTAVDLAITPRAADRKNSAVPASLAAVG